MSVLNRKDKVKNIVALFSSLILFKFRKRKTFVANARYTYTLDGIKLDTRVTSTQFNSCRSNYQACANKLFRLQYPNLIQQLNKKGGKIYK